MTEASRQDRRVVHVSVDDGGVKAGPPRVYVSVDDGGVKTGPPLGVCVSR